VAKKALENTDIPGNSMGSHAAYLRQMVRVAETLQDFERVSDGLWEEDVYISGISVRFPTDDRPEYLVVVRVDGAGGRLVGFHDAPTFLEALVGVVNRLKNRSMQFKEDKYAQRDKG